MSKMQYTIRYIPPKVDKVLRQRVRKTGKSLNAVVVEALAHSAGMDMQTGVFHDLDWFIGGKSLDGKKFDEAAEWLDAAPQDIR